MAMDAEGSLPMCAGTHEAVLLIDCRANSGQQ